MILINMVERIYLIFVYIKKYSCRYSTYFEISNKFLEVFNKNIQIEWIHQQNKQCSKNFNDKFFILYLYISI